MLLSLDRLGNSFNPPRSQQSLRWKGVTDTAIPKSEVECKDAESDSAALTGEKIRAYDGPRRFRNATVDLGDDLYTPLSQFDFGRAVPVCSQWTIVEPSADDNASHLLDLVTLDDWCLLLVGEHAVSSQAHGNRVVVLSFDQLHKDYQRLPEDIGWKNTGHLFAIEHGAELILDTPPDFQFEVCTACVPPMPLVAFGRLTLLVDRRCTMPTFRDCRFRRDTSLNPGQSLRSVPNTTSPVFSTRSKFFNHQETDGLAVSPLSVYQGVRSTRSPSFSRRFLHTPLELLRWCIPLTLTLLVVCRTVR